MTKEEELFVEECNCDIIQKGWQPKVGDIIGSPKDGSTMMLELRDLYDEYGDAVDVKEDRKGCVWCPSLDQLIAMMGERFYKLVNNHKDWCCFLWDADDWDGFPIYGSTRRLACVKAYKEILKEK